MFLYRWLWKMMKGQRLIYGFALLLTLACQSMFIISPYLTQRIVDTFIINDNAAYNIETQSGLLISLLLGMVGFTFLRTSIFYSSIMIYEKTSQSILYRIRGFLFDNIQGQDASFFDYYRTGDIMTRLSGDIDMVRHSIAWVFKNILESFVLFTVTSIYFFILDPLMALCLLALTPIIFLIAYNFRKKIRPMYIYLREQLSKLNTAAEENISGNRVVKAFAREEFEIMRFKEKNLKYKEANQNAALLWLKFFPFLEVSAQLLSVVQLLIGGIFVINGRLTFGEFTAFSALIWTISHPMRMIGHLMNDLQRFTASANKIIEIYYGKPKVIDRLEAKDLTSRTKGEIEFKNVSFKYNRNNVLNNISFKISAGETVAVMGETGSGKTTLINLIPRIYDVNQGSILIDGTDIRMLKLKQLRAAVGIATQDVLLYSDSVENNIAFGDAELSFEEVEEFAKSADAHSFIEKMQDGYDTIIGERGVGLSGGQKQRIALARALAIRPSVLILDDTTSAVDLETEKYIQNSLNNLDFKCTKIIIAQRISSAKNADRIFILRDGKIAEQGTHEELISREGYYQEVYNLQK